MLEVGDIVLCTVDRIVGTNVFVKMENGEEGCIVFSEIAPGRIRNIRDYVVPRKKIACKVLRISGDRIDLSFRRVTLKEQKEAKESYNQEKSYESILKSILGEKAGFVLEKISENEKLYDFLDKAKENPATLEKLTGKENAKKILDIINVQQKQKKIILKKEISLTTQDSQGINIIKKILGTIGGIEVKYVAAGRYSLKTESNDIKKADHELVATIEEIEKQAKKSGAEFSIIKK